MLEVIRRKTHAVQTGALFQSNACQTVGSKFKDVGPWAAYWIVFSFYYIKVDFYLSYSMRSISLHTLRNYTFVVSIREQQG